MVELQEPAHITRPELYQNRPRDDPERRWFEDKGYDFSTRQYKTRKVGNRPEERPSHITRPWAYRTRRDGDPERNYFENRGLLPPVQEGR
jgi:hypothetical protein